MGVEGVDGTQFNHIQHVSGGNTPPPASGKTHQVGVKTIQPQGASKPIKGAQANPNLAIAKKVGRSVLSALLGLAALFTGMVSKAFNWAAEKVAPPKQGG